VPPADDLSVNEADPIGDVQLRALVDLLPDLVFVIVPDGSITFANGRAGSELGVSIDDWIGRSIVDLVHPDDIAGVLTSIDSVQRKEVGTPVEVRVRDGAGEWRWFEVIGTNATSDEHVGGVIGVARDITRRRMWEVAANDTTRFQQVVQFAPAITLLLDRDGVITSVNGAFSRLLGHDIGAVVGRPLVSFVAPGAAHEMRHALEQLRRDGRTASFEVPMTLAGEPDRTRPVRFEMVSLVADPVVAGIVVSGHDVSELEIVREELEYLARHDSLTGLANRSYLVTLLQRQLVAGRRFAVLFIDLDRFKPVNDLYGHETGDELLRLVGRRLAQASRPRDLVARVGGDEFVVVALGIETRAAARHFADRIEQALSSPYQVEAGPVRIGASIGISLPDGQSTVASLLSDADLEMYDAKSERRGASVRSPASRRRSAIERRRLADEFSLGLRRGEVVAHLQPIVDLCSRSLVGFEALARWHHPDHGLLLPGAFMDLVEDAGLDIDLGDAVLDSACRVMARLGEHGIVPELGINLSVGQLTDPGLAARVRRTLDRHRIEPDRLVVEITEQAMLARRSAVGAVTADETLRSMHEMGATLSLDDFGTGYSSLTHVRRFPLGAIKIDRSFVAGMCANVQDHALVEVIVGLGRALDLVVVAEGVESREQLEALGRLGCGQVQGHFVAPAMAPEHCVDWAVEREVATAERGRLTATVAEPADSEVVRQTATR
jgi:diguanylate cyclase (GGDEF)-like protein/PAS domain S-box-containing protein